MANSTNLNNPETTTNAQIQGAGLILPSGVNERDSNKLSTLFTPNSSVLYSKYSPYPEGQSGGFFNANQPYIVTNINDANKGINSTLKWAPFQPSAIIDVVRITKFSVSNPGIKFLLKQVYLQGYQPFNETKIYNPLMPVQSAARVASFGLLDRPIRHIEPNLGGVLGALGVKGVASAFGFNPPNPPPRGTAPGKDGTPLSIINRGDGKGLTRGATATSAYNGKNYSYLSGPSKSGFLTNIKNFFKSSTLFGAFFTIGQPAGTIYKGDDNTYSLMLTNKTIRSYISAYNKKEYNVYGTNGVVQRWSSVKIQSNPEKFSRYLNQYVDGISYSNQSFKIDVNNYRIDEGEKIPLLNYNYYNEFIGISRQGYETSDILFLYNDYLTNKKYPTKLISLRKREKLDNIKHTLDQKKGWVIESGGYIKDTKILDPAEKSPIIKYEYDDYINPEKKDTDYPTKLTSKKSEFNKDKIYTREELDKIKHRFDQTEGKSVLEQKSGYENSIVDTTKDPKKSNIEKTFNKKYVGDDDGNYPTTFKEKQNDFVRGQISRENDQNKKLANVLKNNYNFIPPEDLTTLRGKIDAHIKDNVGGNKKLNYFGSYKNKKDLLDDPTGKGFAGFNQSDSINLLGVTDDNGDFINKDLIKFYFYDIYNKKYIPFRATVKGISERSAISWDDFQYIGNADKVYNYKGFTRALSFSFNVVAMSVKEMAPMWQRINYLMGLSKPANYRNGFIVPPLVMITIGDIYKDQPIVINSVGMTIPDNATWETINDSSLNYEYLNGRLKSNDTVTIAQFPREAEISIDANILEKEKPKVGRNNFSDVTAGDFGKQLSIVGSEKEKEEYQKQYQMSSMGN